MTDSHDLVPAAAAASLAAHVPSVATYAAASKSSSTKRAYLSDWQHFTTWCTVNGVDALPATPETVAAYIATLADGTHTASTATTDDARAVPQPMKVATITRKLAAISQAHKLAGQSSPSTHEYVRTVLKGIRRIHGVTPDAKAAATTDVIKDLLAQVPTSGATGLRDRALLLVGFAGAFRRSELVALDRSDITFDRRGMKILVRTSKTDQEGAGMTKAIVWGRYTATCPIHALEAWLDYAGITAGPIFRPIHRNGTIRSVRMTDQSVALVVKRYATAAGLPAADFAGHSLRSGLVTSAVNKGVAAHKIMAQTGHKNSQMLDRYIHDAKLFDDNASGSVDL